MIKVPARYKFSKVHKPNTSHKLTKCNTVVFGQYGIQAQNSKIMRLNELLAANKVITKKIKKAGKVWQRICPHIPYTKKGAEVKLGKGKGKIEYFASSIKPGCVLFEYNCASLELAKDIAMYAGDKLGIRIKLILKKTYLLN